MAHSIKTDICIIGGGTASLFFLRSLLNFQSDLNVVVLESGPIDSCRSTSDIYNCKSVRSSYTGITDGRSFGFGGTSSLWGGQMIPISQSDMLNRPHVKFPQWPISFSELFADIESVCSLISIANPFTTSSSSLFNQLNSTLTSSSPFLLRHSAWIPFSQRNFAHLVPSLDSFPNTSLLSDHHVTSFLLQKTDSGFTIGNVSGIDRSDGTLFSISASHFIIAAGAIESTRLLLQLQDDYKHVGFTNTNIGRYFQDHLSVEAASINVHHSDLYSHYVSPKFENNLMFTPRFELDPSFQKSELLPSSFLHFTFKPPSSSALNVVRDYLRSKQNTSNSVNINRLNYGRAGLEFLGIAKSRFLEKCLFMPADSVFKLLIDLEQFPSTSNRLYLDTAKVDSLGRKCLNLDWSISDQDRSALSTISSHFTSFWNTNPALANSATLTLNDINSFNSAHDVYHPTGSLRFGINEDSSVLDPNLKVWSINNLWVTSTAVLPSPGSANPGLSHLCLTYRLARHISSLF